MLPVQDILPSRTTPWVTIGLMALIALVVLVETVLPEPAVRTLIVSYGLIPAQVSATTAVSSLFLHHGLLDAAANMWMLWIFGDNLEDRLGHGRFLAFFLLCGASSGLAMVWLDPEALLPVVGAAGAVGGIIGGYLVLLPASRVLIAVPVWRGLDLVEIPAAILLGFWVLAVGLFAGGQPGPIGGLPLSLSVPVAGSLLGAVLVWLFRRPDREQCDWWNVRADHGSPDRRRMSRETSASSVSSASN